MYSGSCPEMRCPKIAFTIHQDGSGILDRHTRRDTRADPRAWVRCGTMDSFKFAVEWDYYVERRKAALSMEGRISIKSKRIWCHRFKFKSESVRPFRGLRVYILEGKLSSRIPDLLRGRSFSRPIFVFLFNKLYIHRDVLLIYHSRLRSMMMQVIIKTDVHILVAFPTPLPVQNGLAISEAATHPYLTSLGRDDYSRSGRVEPSSSAVCISFSSQLIGPHTLGQASPPSFSNPHKNCLRHLPKGDSHSLLDLLPPSPSLPPPFSPSLLPLPRPFPLFPHL